MKIRVMGTKIECELAKDYYKEFVKDNASVKTYSISELYANRGNSNLFRVYIDIDYIFESTAKGSINPKKLKGKMTNREYLNTLSDEDFIQEILCKVSEFEEKNFDVELDVFDITSGTRFDFEEWLEQEYKEKTQNELKDGD